MDFRERDKSLDELQNALTSGSITDSTSEQLQRWLVALSTGNINNPTVHPREIIRGLTINHIQMARTVRHFEETIQRLGAANRKTQCLVILLAIIAIVIGIVQTAVAIIPFVRR